jgi:hypothetical protein
MITTTNNDASILALPELSQTASFKIQATASVCFATPLVPNILFFGLVNPG